MGSWLTSTSLLPSLLFSIVSNQMPFPSGAGGTPTGESSQNDIDDSSDLPHRSLRASLFKVLVTFFTRGPLPNQSSLFKLMVGLEPWTEVWSSNISCKEVGLVVDGRWRGGEPSRPPAAESPAGTSGLAGGPDPAVPLLPRALDAPPSEPERGGDRRSTEAVLRRASNRSTAAFRPPRSRRILGFRRLQRRPFQRLSVAPSNRSTATFRTVPDPVGSWGFGASRAARSSGSPLRLRTVPPPHFGHPDPVRSWGFRRLQRRPL
ncbi:hypothetical protein VNO78_16343 [Psophocarpus tetragonolobus]|uniref:Uncharacterized protein n=1 Tax=Psophocarpus tetragonolobus TaxID=3891 RepID=A0AAN9XK13_PSOTE